MGIIFVVLVCDFDAPVFRNSYAYDAAIHAVTIISIAVQHNQTVGKGSHDSAGAITSDKETLGFLLLRRDTLASDFCTFSVSSFIGIPSFRCCLECVFDHISQA